MRFSMSNCESNVKLKFQVSEHEMSILRKKGLIGNAPKVVRNKKVVCGGELIVSNNFRSVEVTQTGFGWYELCLERKSLFLMDCPNHHFLKNIKRLIELALDTSPKEEEEKPVYLRKLIRLKDGVPVHKTALYKVDITASLLEKVIPNVHKDFYAQQAKTKTTTKTDQPRRPANDVPKAQQQGTPASADRLAALQRKFQKELA